MSISTTPKIYYPPMQVCIKRALYSAALYTGETAVGLSIVTMGSELAVRGFLANKISTIALSSLGLVAGFFFICNKVQTIVREVRRVNKEEENQSGQAIAKKVSIREENLLLDPEAIHLEILKYLVPLDLPNEILLEMFKYLDNQDLLRLRVCVRLNGWVNQSIDRQALYEGRDVRTNFEDSNSDLSVSAQIRAAIQSQTIVTRCITPPFSTPTKQICYTNGRLFVANGGKIKTFIPASSEKKEWIESISFPWELFYPPLQLPNRYLPPSSVEKIASFHLSFLYDANQSILAESKGYSSDPTERIFIGLGSIFFQLINYRKDIQNGGIHNFNYKDFGVITALHYHENIDQSAASVAIGTSEGNIFLLRQEGDSHTQKKIVRWDQDWDLPVRKGSCNGIAMLDDFIYCGFENGDAQIYQLSSEDDEGRSAILFSSLSLVNASDTTAVRTMHCAYRKIFIGRESGAIQVAQYAYPEPNWWSRISLIPPSANPSAVLALVFAHGFLFSGHRDGTVDVLQYSKATQQWRRRYEYLLPSAVTGLTFADRKLFCATEKGVYSLTFC